MKTNLILTTALALMSMSSFAQTNDGRIPTKGFAVYEEKGNVQDGKVKFRYVIDMKTMK